jgi:hypothetical protein
LVAWLASFWFSTIAFGASELRSAGQSSRS